MRQKTELVPPEICTKCGKSIGPKVQAYLWKDECVCRKCYFVCKHEQEKLDWENRPASEAQLGFLRDLGVAAPAGVTVPQASVLIEAALAERKKTRRGQSRGGSRPGSSRADHVMHFISGLWLHTRKHRLRQYGIDRDEVRMVAEELIEREPDLARSICELLEDHPHSEEFIPACPWQLEEQMKELLELEWRDRALLTTDEEDAAEREDWRRAQ